MIEIGDGFPEFSLSDQDGRVWSLSDFAGAEAVFYFYPKDDTTGCTVEACEFRDALPHFSGARVVGISPDNARSHQKFVDKCSLTFVLLADTDHALAESCGVWVEKSMYGKKYMGIERSTFLVGGDGIVKKIWRKVKAQGHAEEVRAALS